MTEGGATKPKRNGTRIFKNPPQPHMCIQDYMQGSELPCYVNVLSWDKVTLHYSLYQNVPLYGGMRVSPPRGEKAEVGVFAVIANPELLKLYGKNAQDPKEQSTLIEALLDFVETKNEGVYFSRQYTILKDKDITGELKEVWMAVQAKRDRENLQPQHETWIDAQPPAPQYPQYSDQQQTQQQQQQQQQLQTAPQQQQQHHVEYAQPPQYRSNAAYSIGSVPSNEIVNHEREIRFNYQQQNPVVTQSEQISLSFNPQDRCYNYRERGRPNIQQNPTQQNCPAYPAPQYQFQQLPRQMVPQYVKSFKSNKHIKSYPNYNMANQDCNNFSSKFYEMKGLQQQATEKNQPNNTMFVIDHMLKQQQMQQHQVQHQQQIHQQHQIQMQQHQIQEQQQQYINYQQQTNQQYQRPTQQQQQTSQNQSQSENLVEMCDTRSKSNLNSMKPTMRKQYTSIPKSKNNERHDSPQSKLPTFWDKGAFNGASPSELRRLDGNMKWLNQPGLSKKQLEVQQQEQQIQQHHQQQQQQHTTLTDTEPQIQMYQNDMTNKVPDSSKRSKKIYPRKLKNQTFDGDQVIQMMMDEGYHRAYTILKKPEASTTSGESNVLTSGGLENEIDKKLAQISIEDCKDVTEVSAVLS